MMDYDKFRHDRSRYERPNKPFVCGRAAQFGKACEKGPGADGSCGGCFECEPFKNGDRWECRRPAQLGGKCETGPNPDGTCCKSHTACTPQPTIRRRRGQLTILAAAASIALIIVALGTSFLGTDTPLAVDPGQLSASHSAFSQEEGCAACHSDTSTPTAFLDAAVSHNVMDAKCTECHNFGGPAEAAHNSNNPAILQASLDWNDGEGLACATCHSEHEGLNASLVDMNDAQCNSCHLPEKHVTSFSKDHPAFSAPYPYNRRTSLRFDHVAHFGKYFSQVTTDEPMSCLTCHEVGDSSVQAKSINPVGFDGACQSCHAEDIPKNELTLFVLPEMDEQTLELADIAETCGIDWDEDAAADEEYEAVSFEETVPGMGMLVEADITDSAEYTEPLQELLAEMVDFGREPLQERLAEQFGDEAAEYMLAGLPNSLVQRAACAWAMNQEFDPGDDEVDKFGGWYATELALMYKPSSQHPDKVVKAWIDASLAKQVEGDIDDERSDALEELVGSMTGTRGGIGNCSACHGLSLVDEELAASHGTTAFAGMEWNYRNKDSSPHVNYDHGPHLNILGPGSTCTNCHKPDNAADFAGSFDDTNPFTFASNFAPISVTSCQECHGEQQVRSDCLTCHQYHNEPGFNAVMSMPETAAKAE